MPPTVIGCDLVDRAARPAGGAARIAGAEDAITARAASVRLAGRGCPLRSRALGPAALAALLAERPDLPIRPSWPRSAGSAAGG